MKFWLNPSRMPLPQGVDLALRFGGTLTPVGTSGTQTVNTGIPVVQVSYGVGFGNELRFDLTYSIVLLKKGLLPSGTMIAFNNFDVFQLDGTTAVNNNTNASRMRQRIMGTVQIFSGGTCSLAAGDQAKTIILPPVTTQVLPTIGASAGKTAFSLSVNNCDEAVRTAKFSFSGQASTDRRYFANSGTARGVAIKLSTDPGDTLIAPQDGPTGANQANLPISGRSGELKLFAQYIRVSELAPGTVAGQVILSITYQ